MSRFRSVLVMASALVLLAPATSSAQAVPPDMVLLRERLAQVHAMAQAAIDQCRQIERGCQDIWCQVNPAFDAHVAAWPEADAVQVLCAQYHPEGDQSSVRELEPTLGSPNAAPDGGWSAHGAPTRCGARGEACREVAVGVHDRRLARLHVVVPYGSERRYVDATILVTRRPFRPDRAAWVDPRPPPRADAAVMAQRLVLLQHLARSLAPACGASLGEPGPRGAPLDLAATPLATWREWPGGVDVQVACSHATGPATTTGWVMGSRGSIAFGGGIPNVPWGAPDARCIRPGTPCAQYLTFTGHPELLMFQTEVRTPGDRGFVSIMLFLHTGDGDAGVR